MDEALLRCKESGRLEAGCDEAGRGCLAGPVFAAAVIFERPFGKRNSLIRDSKLLSEKQRQEARIWIEEHALTWAVGRIDPPEIDDINILQAAVKAMHVALAELKPQPDFILVDGHYFHPFPSDEAPIPHSCEVKGDSRFFSIAAASILAKTHRDEYMLSLHERHPEYGWDSNKGYPTAAHRRALKKYGPSPHHRRSFRLI